MPNISHKTSPSSFTLSPPPKTKLSSSPQKDLRHHGRALHSSRRLGPQGDHLHAPRHEPARPLPELGPGEWRRRRFLFLSVFLRALARFFFETLGSLAPPPLLALLRRNAPIGPKARIFDVPRGGRGAKRRQKRAQWRRREREKDGWCESKGGTSLQQQKKKKNVVHSTSFRSLETNRASLCVRFDVDRACVRRARGRDARECLDCDAMRGASFRPHGRFSSLP